MADRTPFHAAIGSQFSMTLGLWIATKPLRMWKVCRKHACMAELNTWAC